MNITFLIGNGFDIGLGLETQYEKFYQEYCKIKENDSINIKEFKEYLKTRNSEETKKIIDWADFEKAFGEHSADFEPENDKLYNYQKRRYIERFENFAIAFNAYIEKQEKLLDFSDEKLISKTMLEGVTTYYHIRAQDRLTLENIYNTTAGERIYNFITFNYTTTVDRCTTFFKEFLKSQKNRYVGKVLHIHGYIRENMIMGVNDPSQIKNLKFSDDTEIIRELVKPQQNADVRSNYENPVIDTINSSHIICIYGMSIGETDKKWWKIIAEWLQRNTKRALVILKYDTNYDSRFPFRQNQQIDPIIDNFLKLSEVPTDVADEIRSRIYVGINHNVFQMNLLQNFSNKDAKNEDITPELLITNK